MKSDRKPIIQREKSGIVVKLIAPIILLLFLACGGLKQSGSAEAGKDYQKLTELVNSGKFEIENEWLMPLGGSMINLIGNPNYIKFRADSVEVFLPYFGVRHSGGGFGRDEGITYKGHAENLNITEDTVKNNILVKFEGRNGNEILEFFITLFPGGSSTTAVSSSQRQSISYRGNVKALPKEKQ